MMAQSVSQSQSQPKHLHELLREDQEPFLLKTYIANKRNQLKTLNPTPKTQLQLKKRKPTAISHNSNFATKFCKNACFFSFHDSPDPTKSPLYCNTFPSPSKSPCKNTPNSIFLPIPAKTSALLLEAALRIQKNSVTKSQTKATRYGIFGSLFKRLTNRSKTQNRDFAYRRGSLDKIKRRKPFETEYRRHVALEETSEPCPCNFSSSRTSTSGVWSEESCFSNRPSQCFGTEKTGFRLGTRRSEDNLEEELEYGSCSDDDLCESPFRFVLQRSSSSCSGTGTPEFTSPSRHEDTSKNNVETLQKLQVEQEEEEEKEQSSPVSVLDPPFEDADDVQDDGDQGMDGFNYKTSYAIVQRAKENLLLKLSRFEKLAELDPVELEKRMMEDDDDDNISLVEDELEKQIVDDQSEAMKPETSMDRLVKEILKSSCYHLNKIPNGMVRLVADLIREVDDEQKMEIGVRRRVCERLEAWKEVDSNTIDMMVEGDFRRELKQWEKNQDQVGETAREIEIAIFGLLIEEMSQDLASFPGFYEN